MNKLQRPVSLKGSRRALSLGEVLIVVAIIGTLTAIALPGISGIHGAGDSTKAMANARHVESISAALGALGVAHVIPESLGGEEATIRLLREGVTVNEGPFTGQMFVIRALSDKEVEEAAKYLEIIYDYHELRLAFSEPHA